MSHIMMVQKKKKKWICGRQENVNLDMVDTVCLSSIDLPSVKEGCATPTLCIDYLMTDTSL